MRKLLLSLIIFAGINISALPLPGQNDSTILFLPCSRIYPVMFLDPLECQVIGSSSFLSQGSRNLSLYSTVNLGFSRPVIAKYGERISWEFNFGAAIFSQFDLIKRDDGSYLAGLMNNDFKLSGDYTIKQKNNLLRFRLFHISSHLGDDYLQRHSDILTNDKSANYEQADITCMRTYRDSYFYAGTGVIYTRYVFRERFSLQGGGVFNFGKIRPVRYFAGLDLKLLAENGYNPDIKTAFGINISRDYGSLLRIWMEYYSGYLPYSTIDYGRINWFGLALAVNIIN